MRARVSPPSISEARVCPYLGLLADPFHRLEGPSAEHRCYLWMQRQRIDLLHQQRFCLTPNHPRCPWLMVAPTAPASGLRGAWQRFRDGVREQFDLLEHATQRASWFRAAVAAVILGIQIVRSAWVEVAPYLRLGLRVSADWLWQQWTTRIRPTLARQLAVWWAQVRERRQPALALAGVDSSGEAEGVETQERSVRTGSTGRRTSGSGGRGRRAKAARAATGVATRWECPTCLVTNPAGQPHCRRCGGLSPLVEQAALAAGDDLVLEGLQALKAGREEAAHQAFVLACAQNPRSELAWYWRARTALTVEEVITCLEELLRLNPDNAQARADLELARLRQAHAAALERERAARAAAARPAPARPGALQRALALGRQAALELASLPCFALGLAWVSGPLGEALASAGLGDLGRYLPVLRWPAGGVTLPAGLVGEAPLVVPTEVLLPFSLAGWYVWLAFRLADALPGTRLLGVVSGLLGLGLSGLVVVKGAWLGLSALLLLALAGVGQGDSRPVPVAVERR